MNKFTIIKSTAECSCVAFDIVQRRYHTCFLIVYSIISAIAQPAHSYTKFRRTQNTVHNFYSTLVARVRITICWFKYPTQYFVRFLHIFQFAAARILTNAHTHTGSVCVLYNRCRLQIAAIVEYVLRAATRAVTWYEAVRIERGIKISSTYCAVHNSDTYLSTDTKHNHFYKSTWYGMSCVCTIFSSVWYLFQEISSWCLHENKVEKTSQKQKKNI